MQLAIDFFVAGCLSVTAFLLARTALRSIWLESFLAADLDECTSCVATMTWSEFIALVLLGLLAGVVIFVLYRSIGVGFVM